MEQQRNQFDEQAALRALEHLRDQIESARSRREQKIAEFEAFVRSNRSASQAERLAALNEREGTAPAVQAAARTADRATEPGLPSRLSEPPFDFEPRPAIIAGSRPIWRDRRFQIAAGIIAVMLLALWFGPWGSDSPEREAANPAPESRPAAPGDDSAAAPASRGSTPASTVPEAAAPAPVRQTPAASSPLRVEITTLRPVWMRVTVDGERTLERQVPGGQKLTYGADRAITVRVGDAGAVQLAVDGVDQGVLGRDGQVVNRTFTPRPR